jgi:flagellar biogenesis protein FliO
MLIINKQTYKPKYLNIMGNLLYIIAVILIIGWLVGFVGFHAGGLIHVLLVIAVIAVLLRLISGKRPV